MFVSSTDEPGWTFGIIMNPHVHVAGTPFFAVSCAAC